MEEAEKRQWKEKRGKIDFFAFEGMSGFKNGINQANAYEGQGQVIKRAKLWVKIIAHMGIFLQDKNLV